MMDIATASLNEARPSSRSATDPTTLLTAREVAALLQVPISWIYEHTRKRGSGRIPHVKLGKYLRFEPESIREFLDRQRQV